MPPLVTLKSKGSMIPRSIAIGVIRINVSLLTLLTEDSSNKAYCVQGVCSSDKFAVREKHRTHAMENGGWGQR